MGTLRPHLNWAGPPEPLQEGKMAGGLRVISSRGLSLLQFIHSHVGTIQVNRWDGSEEEVG